MPVQRAGVEERLDRQCPLMLKQIFDLLDKNGDGDVNKREFIVALRHSELVRKYFGLERVKQEDGTRDAFEAWVPRASLQHLTVSKTRCCVDRVLFRRTVASQGRIRNG